MALDKAYPGYALILEERDLKLGQQFCSISLWTIRILLKSKSPAKRNRLPLAIIITPNWSWLIAWHLATCLGLARSRFFGREKQASVAVWVWSAPTVLCAWTFDPHLLALFEKLWNLWKIMTDRDKALEDGMEAYHLAPYLASALCFLYTTIMWPVSKQLT